MITQYLERCINFRATKGGVLGEVDAEKAMLELEALLKASEDANETDIATEKGGDDGGGTKATSRTSRRKTEKDKQE